MEDAAETPWIIRLVDDRIEHCWSDALERASVLRGKRPGATADALANEMIDDHAFWAGIVGAGVGAASSIPVMGQYIALGAVAPELVYLTKLQFDTALNLAAVYESAIPREMLRPTLLACLVYSMGHDFVKSVVKEAATNLSRRVIEESLKGATLVTAKRAARQLGVEVTKKGLLKAVPLVAIPINAVMNYGGLVLFGKMAKHYFSPNWLMCAACGHIQPRKNRFCSSCAVAMGG
jgi:hypothetical protein